MQNRPLIYFTKKEIEKQKKALKNQDFLINYLQASSIEAVPLILDSLIQLQKVSINLKKFISVIKTIGVFGNLMDKDVHNMKLIKAKWMNADNELATKTAGEIYLMR